MVKQMKKLVHKALRSLGFMMVPDWGIPLIALSRHLQILFQTLKIDCVIDVGANIGQYRDFLRNWVSYKGLIISFEPVLHNVWHLKQRSRQDPMWEIQGYALGSNDTLKELGITSDTQFSSFLTPDNSVVYKKKNVVSTKVDVQVKALDSVYTGLQNRFSFRRPYLKMDTQGYELEVVRGGEMALLEILALQTEASVLPIYHDIPDYRTVISELEDRGFQLSGIFSSNSVGASVLVDFDCVMTRR